MVIKWRFLAQFVRPVLQLLVDRNIGSLMNKNAQK